MYPFNLCSSVLTLLSLEAAIDIATQVGLQGIELRVHPEGHRSISEIEQCGTSLCKQFDKAGLAVPVLTSYVVADDFTTVDRLIACAHQLGAQKIRCCHL